jgi:predicted dehydrogenase
MKRRTFISLSGMSALSLGLPKNIRISKWESNPLKLAVIGLVHTHVHWILGREKKGDIEVVAIVEPNKVLAEKYAKQHGYSMEIVFASMEEMITKVKPEAVTAFGTIYSHLKVVEFFAPLGIHVMVEKPLAVSLAHALKMNALATKYHIHLLTNYETSWYGTNKKAYQYIIEEKKAGEIRKIVFHTGHPGPFEIGCNKEFTDWLTDPVLNGGGALTDFGCYGANLATWLMKGQKPHTVHCVTQQIKPQLYPNVEDESTTTLTYSKAQVIIQASWNWPFNVKDMEVYGQHGYVICKDRQNLLRRWKEESSNTAEALPENNAPYNDPFSYFKAVVRKEITPGKFDVSSPENNMIVMEILEAAKKSAATGKTIVLA